MMKNPDKDDIEHIQKKRGKLIVKNGDPEDIEDFVTELREDWYEIGYREGSVKGLIAILAAVFIIVINIITMI